MSRAPAEPGPSILLIDDSVVDLHRLIAMMSARRMRLHVAHDGREGFHKALVLQPRLILLDMVMPVMDGFATLRNLKADETTRHIPVIFLSASNDVSTRVEALSLGAVDYIGKPFSEQEVIARVGIHLKLAPKPQRAASAPGRESAHRAPTDDARIVDIVTGHVREHLDDVPSPAELARLAGTNETRLNRAFKARLGMAVIGWVREERLLRAKLLLATTATPVATIGQHLGYASAAAFSRAFSERFGCSPRAFRSDPDAPSDAGGPSMR
jgi:CheY-like chemotaxis protein